MTSLTMAHTSIADTALEERGGTDAAHGEAATAPDDDFLEVQGDGETYVWFADRNRWIASWRTNVHGTADTYLGFAVVDAPLAEALESTARTTGTAAPALVGESRTAEEVGRDIAIGMAVRQLRTAGREDVADRLVDVVELLREEEEEWTAHPSSVSTFVRTFTGAPELPIPVVGISPRGTIQAEWPICEKGRLVMDFQAADRIHFVAISAPATADSKRRKLQGTLPRGEVVQQVATVFGWQ